MNDKRVFGDEIALGNRYAQRSDGRYYYPRDRFNNEYMIEDYDYIYDNGCIIYPLNNMGKPRYRRVNGKEIYEMRDGKWIFGAGIDGKQYYAMDQFGNEYYPDDNTPAKMADGTPYYPSSKEGISIFPKNILGNEFYICRIDFNKPETVPNRYARLKSNDEIYPIRLNADNTEEQCLIDNRYAVDKYNNPFYPKDGYQNEYYRKKTYEQEQVILDRYAVTIDQKIILPMFNKKYEVNKNILPHVNEKNIIGTLIREKDVSYDYLTNLTFGNPPTYFKPYKYRSSSTNQIHLVTPKHPTVNFFGIMNISVPFYRKWCFWIAVFLIMIIKALAVWWFFFHKANDFSIKIV